MILLRVVARFQRLAATSSPKSNARKLTYPINAPKGIDKEIVRDNAAEVEPGHEDTVDPARRDITPKDVFNLSPSSGSVLNLVETGKDLSHALEKQIPKDKGWDTVKNLSQYLIRTDGGGGTPPVGRK